MTTSAKFRELYAKVPNANCKGLCHQACSKFIGMSQWEAKRLADGAEQQNHDVSCPFLVNNRCSNYEHRPLICRLYGASEGLMCEHGCVPDSILSKAQAGDLVRAASEIGKGIAFLFDPDELLKELSAP